MRSAAVFSTRNRTLVRNSARMTAGSPARRCGGRRPAARGPADGARMLARSASPRRNPRATRNAQPRVRPPLALPYDFVPLVVH